ncbi:MAG: hypothetical protein PVG35_07155 [Desulfobacterales bacterium]|jgi:hypothetical protein
MADMHQMGADLMAIAARFEKITGHHSAVAGNPNNVTSDGLSVNLACQR